MSKKEVLVKVSKTQGVPRGLLGSMCDKLNGEIHVLVEVEDLKDYWLETWRILEDEYESADGQFIVRFWEKGITETLDYMKRKWRMVVRKPSRCPEGKRYFIYDIEDMTFYWRVTFKRYCDENCVNLRVDESPRKRDGDFVDTLIRDYVDTSIIDYVSGVLHAAGFRYTPKSLDEPVECVWRKTIRMLPKKSVDCVFRTIDGRSHVGHFLESSCCFIAPHVMFCSHEVTEYFVIPRNPGKMSDKSEIKIPGEFRILCSDGKESNLCYVPCSGGYTTGVVSSPYSGVPIFHGKAKKTPPLKWYWYKTSYKLPQHSCECIFQDVLGNQFFGHFSHGCELFIDENGSPHYASSIEYYLITS